MPRVAAVWADMAALRGVALLAVCLVVDTAGAARSLRPERLIRGEAANRIVGGEYVDIRDVPYQISLRFMGSHMCGGSLIAPRYVVTACHCVDGREPESMSILAGTDCRIYGGQLVNVSRIAKHPYFDQSTIDHDVAVLELSECVTHPDAAAVDLATETPPDGSNATISGWGTRKEGASSVPYYLRRAQVYKVPDHDCKKAYGEGAITSTMACYGTLGGGVDSCQGDSGGPAVVDGALAGIVSWGYGCARKEYPGVYTDVCSVLDFILGAVEDRNDTSSLA